MNFFSYCRQRRVSWDFRWISDKKNFGEDFLFSFHESMKLVTRIPVPFWIRDLIKMYPYLQYTKVYKHGADCNSNYSEPILLREQEMYNVDVLEFSSPPVTRISIFLVAKGEIEGHFQTVSTIFANSAVNTEKVGGNIVKFYQRRGDESWPSLQGGERTFRVLARNRLRSSNRSNSICSIR